ncbi:hypothetical protein AYK26_01565 [Euryarchaeota archaeon SM23-78]|nr:MAG: hypothetical protein AYK26_01565 [Euryarchaeota archaeon SM23-78]MBW3000445.1 hypothetical protein [Candidatus Woesearchaeota archaeon]
MQIVNIPVEKYFYTKDGTVIKHLGELPEALRNMSPETFAHHVDEYKNDFHDWIKDVFELSTLARKIRNIKRKEDMAKHVFIEIFS